MQGREFDVGTADGRTLGARVAGPDDGPLVVYLSGTPGTNILYAPHVELGADRGMRHAGYSRPGYGRSDRLPGRTVASCAADVAAVADALGVDRFYVHGHSGGAPHALACAALLPDRVIAAAAVSGFVPPQVVGAGWLEGVAAENVEEFAAAAGDEAAHVRIIERYQEEWRQVETEDQMREAFRAFYSGNDWKALQVERNLRYQLECVHRIAREGVWGWLDDDRADVADWGFAVEEIRVPVAIWHGEEDPGLPAWHASWLADRIPSSSLRLLPGEGHMSLMEYQYGAILDELVALGAGRA